MDFKRWFFEAKTREDYETIFINLLNLDSKEGMNQKLDTLDPDKLKKQIEDVGEFDDLSPEKKERINDFIDNASSADSINDLISIMLENDNLN